MVALPEKSTMERVLRIRGIAQSQWVAQMILHYATAYGAMVVLAVGIALGATGVVAVPGMIAFSVSALVMFGIHEGLNCRGQLARADRAFNNEAWPARIELGEAGESMEDPVVRERVRGHMFRAVRLLGSAEAAGLYQEEFGENPLARIEP